MDEETRIRITALKFAVESARSPEVDGDLILRRAARFLQFLKTGQHVSTPPKFKEVEE